MSLSVEQALVHSYWECPDDPTAQLEHMQMHLDRCDEDERAVWSEAIQIAIKGGRV